MHRNPIIEDRMIDSFGRRVTYLRMSVTDRCDLRCVYCMSERMQFLPSSEVLTLPEIDRLCRAFVSLGVQKIRLTGGEPLVRWGIMTLIESLGELVKGQKLRELTLTTNGTQLTKYADALVRSGVRRINVSVDSLDKARFRQITRVGDLDRVMQGIEAAREAGLAIKINAVALKGTNDDEFEALVDWCGVRGFDLTFIETMPMGWIETDRTDQFISLADVRARLEERYSLHDVNDRTGGPARYVRVAGTGQRIGFITPMSHNFCESCNRVRVTCTGTLYTCLGQEQEVELRQPLLSGASDAELQRAIISGIKRKPKGHDFIIDRRAKPSVGRHMSVTGG